MGSTVETAVIAVWGLTRSPTWTLAIPTMPSIGDTTLVQPRLRSACSTAASADATAALASRSAIRALSSSCWLIARCAAKGVKRSTSFVALASWAGAGTDHSGRSRRGREERQRGASGRRPGQLPQRETLQARSLEELRDGRNRGRRIFFHQPVSRVGNDHLLDVGGGGPHDDGHHR